MLRFLGVNFLIVTILLFGTNMGYAELMKQEVLAQSKIKKSSFKGVFNEIKKILPRDSRKCSIVVENVKLLRIEHDAPTENWTVNICQEKKEYCVQAYWLKGSYFVAVKLKEDVLAKEKQIWDASKKDHEQYSWRDTLNYFNELEAMDKAITGVKPRQVAENK